MTTDDIRWHQMTSDVIRGHQNTSDDIRIHQIKSARRRITERRREGDGEIDGGNRKEGEREKLRKTWEGDTKWWDGRRIKRGGWEKQESTSYVKQDSVIIRHWFKTRWPRAVPQSIDCIREAFQLKKQRNLGISPNMGGGRQKIKKVPSSRGYQRLIKWWLIFISWGPKNIKCYQLLY